ncbi:hypothetical protein JEQ12_008244 [Ovis aries]|uniref:Uncharacterized protein n=1 Tax=Ovis aries TaxID=9940 RepID=A0A836CSQ5_SHEEP|nr:hypothetical protein JEQ12_008244 [Ovis aries]
MERWSSKIPYLILTISSGYLTKFWISPYGQQVDVEVYMENVEDGTRQVCVVPLESPRAEARVHIGQVVTSIYTNLQNEEHVIEALHRAKFKFPAHQKIHLSK